jgi:hypothetical protein
VLSSANVVAFKSCGICKIAIPPGLIRGFLHGWYHLVCVQNVVTQNHIVLIQRQLQISAFTSASGENKSVVV